MKPKTSPRLLEFSPSHAGLKQAAEAVLAAIKARADFLATPESAKTDNVDEIARLAVAALNAASALYVAAGVSIVVKEQA